MQFKNHATADAAQSFATKKTVAKLKKGYTKVPWPAADADNDVAAAVAAPITPPAKRLKTTPHAASTGAAVFASAPIGKVDPASGLQDTGIVFRDAQGVLWDCELNLLDLSKHHDKYYSIQVHYRTAMCALSGIL